MTRAQQYIRTLMENVSEGQIGSDEHRMTFAKIRGRLTDAEDFGSELQSLYKVRGLGDFALGLMWLAEQVENDSAKNDYSQEEQSFIVNQFRTAVGDAGELASRDQTTAAPETVEMPAATPELPVESTEETPEMPQHLQMETAGTISESDKAVYAPPPAEGAVSDDEFVKLLEQFFETVHSGAEERDGLLKTVVEQSNAISSAASGSPGDLKEFCQYLVEFLNYIHENGFMDDVRVMNIVSNVSDSVVSWREAAPDAREGVLAEGTEILRSFKSLFE